VSNYPRFLPAGDTALVVEFGSEIDPLVNQQVHRLAALLAAEPLAGVIEFVPTYRSLLIHYDPLHLTYSQVINWVDSQLPGLESTLAAGTRLVEVPTVYGGEHGPDLESAARTLGLSIDDVIQLHSAVEYRVYMMGFTPGYPYMGKLDARLQLPRLETPRTLVPAGSVAIAGLQTGIYPLSSPGGWHIIGHTRLILFDPNREAPFLFAPGDRVRFVPVGA
jgi:KipI family sensor histidine kinase inhibitor